MIRCPYIPDARLDNKKERDTKILALQTKIPWDNHGSKFSKPSGRFFISAIGCFNCLKRIHQQNGFRYALNVQEYWMISRDVSEDVLVLELLSSQEKEVERQLTNCRDAVPSVIFEAHLSITSWARWVPKVRRCWSGLGLLQELLGQIFRKTGQRNVEVNSCYRHRCCPL